MSTSAHIRAAVRRPGITLIAALVSLVVLAGVLLTATAAHAEERTVRGGRLDWGIKSSFQSYVTGPVAHGSWTLQGGAATVGDSQFRFHSASGGYDPDSGAFRAAFSGGVHFTGHKKGGSYELDLTIGRPTVKVSGGSGTLYADMVSKEKGTGKVTTAAQVPLASLDVSGLDMKGGSGPIALTGLPATLTSQGAKAFAGYYAAGTRLDPVSLSTDLAPKPAAENPSGKGAESPAKDKDKGGKGKGDKDRKGAKAAGRIEDAAVDWGVRRTFREYVTGSIAHGKWTLSGGAQDGGALFRFPRGEGTYDPKKHTLDADFAGGIRFTGKHGLDIALSKVTVAVRDGRGTLSADVDSKDLTAKKTPLITFKAGRLAPKDGLVTLTEAPAELTAQGARTFGSMYKAGTAMDPVSLSVALDADAQLPALPDLGSSASPQPEAKKAAADTERTAKASDGSSAGSSSAVPIGIGAGVAVLLAAGITFGVLRRRSAATESTESTD
ncbi:HtaA domain-containing protein [Streptomyces sp. NPDC059009]|uniref:HtaA domain-containing protein n=1 Tax=Streptomyces sp. NPDC059009 TaxID=3346694 RepID=UPI0036D0244A